MIILGLLIFYFLIDLYRIFLLLFHVFYEIHSIFENFIIFTKSAILSKNRYVNDEIHYYETNYYKTPYLLDVTHYICNSLLSKISLNLQNSVYSHNSLYRWKHTISTKIHYIYERPLYSKWRKK